MNGILLINKESGFTSRDVINKLNKIINTKKIGHTGTLDPIATGVLVVCIGKYTKLVDKITAYDKEYIATITLGIRTDTLDKTGTILEKNDKRIVEQELLINTLNSFLGVSMQEVPSFSAVKIKGKKLYEYARNNEQIELPKRKIEIKEIELLENKEGEIKFRTVVSKGTYIRSLIRDVCNKLEVLGTMSELTRTRQGKFTLKEAYTLQEVEKGNYNLLTLEDIFAYPEYQVNKEEYKKVKNGATMYLKEKNPFLFMKYEGKIIAIYELKEDTYKPYFML